MIAFDLIAAYCLSVIVLASIPGLAVSSLTIQTLQFGRQAGIEMAFGISIARLSKLALILIALPTIQTASPAIFAMLGYCGAAFLIWNAIRILQAPSPFKVKALHFSCPRKARSRVISGFVISWANPKTIIFIATILPRFVQETTDWMGIQIALLGFIWLLIAMVVETLYIWGAEKLQGRLQKYDIFVAPAIAFLMLIIALWIALNPPYINAM
ncbi:MAG: LysE family translocator [Cohaesibacter sp.]|jgi:threonine/homoserine/homoserine lactone efflux protein|nr:LysE family translocator [Cohaesibacter sp.]